MKIGLVHGGGEYQIPLALATVAALTPKGHEVEIVSKSKFQDKYDLVGMNVLTSTAPELYCLADKIYSPVIMGGPHVSFMQEEALAHADSIVMGEAEDLWQKALNDFKTGNLQKVYKQTPPKFSTLAKHDLLHGSLHDKLYFIEVARGCHNKCSYCVPTQLYGKYRHRAIEDIIDELQTVEQERLWLIADNLSCDKEYSFELFSQLKDLRKRWFASFEIEKTDKKFLEAAAKGGCKQVFVGFDSIDQINLNLTSQKKVDQYETFIRDAHDLGIKVMGCFVFGFDNDTKKTFEHTKEFIDKNRIDIPVFTLFTPFPGTPIFEKYKNRLTTTDWSKFDFKHVTYQPEKMTSTELKKEFDKIISKYFYKYFDMFDL